MYNKRGVSASEATGLFNKQSIFPSLQLRLLHDYDLGRCLTAPRLRRALESRGKHFGMDTASAGSSVRITVAVARDVDGMTGNMLGQRLTEVVFSQEYWGLQQAALIIGQFSI